MKKLLVACGNGIATSTVVGHKIKERCEAKKIAVSITQCKVTEVASKASDYDLIVTSGKFEDASITTPIVGAIALLTGINEDATLDKIVSYLK